MRSDLSRKRGEVKWGLASTGFLALHLAKLDIAQATQLRSVEIDEPQPAAMRDEIRWQRVVAEGGAAEMWGQAADVGQGVDLDPKQAQRGVTQRHLERHACQTQEAGGIGRGEEAVDEGLLDLVEIGLHGWRRSRAMRLMRRLPLGSAARGVRQIVARTMRRMRMVVVVIMTMMVVMVMIMRVIVMVVIVRMVMVVMIVATHGTLNRQQAC